MKRKEEERRRDKKHKSTEKLFSDYDKKRREKAVRDTAKTIRRADTSYCTDDTLLYGVDVSNFRCVYRKRDIVCAYMCKQRQSWRYSIANSISTNTQLPPWNQNEKRTEALRDRSFKVELCSSSSKDDIDFPNRVLPKYVNDDESCSVAEMRWETSYGKLKKDELTHRRLLGEMRFLERRENYAEIIPEENVFRAINVNNVTMKRSEFTPIVKINEFIYKIPESHISLKLSKQAVVTIHKDNDPFRTNLFSKRREDLVEHLAMCDISFVGITPYGNTMVSRISSFGRANGIASTRYTSAISGIRTGWKLE
uniref:Uncharacterized protein n=1 Tax=Vespula pensylvanica TaxID=30213 RepID=A0A834PFW6_VESPE|nr:hypothetical protein H0235_001318 [Vespula pensylvanica]